MTAIETVTGLKYVTADLGGKATTKQFTDTVIEHLA